ncbi:MAG: biotin/lipoyl-binding protein [Planctomycetota bacterium]
MKKWLILIVVVALVVVVWLVARNRVMVPIWAQPKFGPVTRGDIRVPITAAGLIHASEVIEIKPEASGVVTDVPVIEGTYLKRGDTLVVINPDDEQRMVDRAQANYDRAEALLRQARVAVEQAQVKIDGARAQLAELEAQAAITQFELEKQESYAREGRAEVYSAQSLNDARARHAIVLAQQASARVAIRAAELARQDTEAAVASQEAVVKSARKELEDAQSRLRKTTVLAPRDAIVTQVFVKAGNLVQSGTQSIMGGSQLMMLADVSKKKVIARLDEADYGRVLAISPVDALPDMPGLRQAAAENAEQIEKRTGRVRVTVDAFPDQHFEGRIERVEPQGKLNAGSSIIQFDVHVEITDPQRHMLPLGAQAQVEFTVESAVGVLRVPAEAVKTFEDQRGVYVKTTPAPGSGEQWGKRFVACRFGVSDGEYTQVIEALGGFEIKEGLEVYTRLPQELTEE